MFREMERRHQQLSDAECVEVLKNGVRGVLSVLGDDGYPYGLPMDYWYCEEDGNFYFHSGMTGHKLDAMTRCDKVSFCVCDEGSRREGEWFLHFRSVIVFGRVKIVTDAERKASLVRRLSLQFTKDEVYIDSEIRELLDRTLCFALVPEHMTGKRVNER